MDKGGVPIKRTFVITKLNYDLILGHDWLIDVNPDIDWVNKTIKLRNSTAKTVQCTVLAREIQINIISANQAKRIMGKVYRK